MKKNLLTLLLCFATYFFVAAQWTRQSTIPLDSNFTLAAITPSFADPSVAFVSVADFNSLVFEDFVASEGGKKIERRLNSPKIASTNFIGQNHVIDKDNMYAIIGSDNNFTTISVRESHDGAKTWSKVPKVFTASASFPNAIQFWDKNNGMMMGDPTSGYYEIYTTSDAGKNWKRVAKTAEITAKDANEAAIIGTFTATREGGLYFPTYDVSANEFVGFLMSEDKGLTWKRGTFPPKFIKYIAGATIAGYDVFVNSSEDFSMVGYYQVTQDSIAVLNFATHDAAKTWNEPVNIADNLEWGKNSAYNTLDIIPGTPYLTSTVINNNDSTFIALSKDDGKTWNYIYTKGYKASEDDLTLVGSAQFPIYFTKFVTPQDAWMSAPTGIIRYKGGNITGSNDWAKSPLFTLNTFPNPATEIVNIEFELENATYGEAAIYDLAGRKVEQILAPNSMLFTGKNQLQWRPNVANGNYFVYLDINGQHITRKIAVQKN
jgi:hypothetical protein